MLALSGGVGGAKLALGLQRALPAGALAVLVNTGDDFGHLGLAISPDLDSVLYALAGVVNPDTGWGRADESWNFHAEIARLGGPAWFRLGDRDLAVHVERPRRRAAGEPLGSICAELARAFGLATHIWPMSDDPVRTLVDCERGTLEFQHYFVRERCEPAVRGLRYEGAAVARPNPDALALLRSRELDAVVICPSNPYLSVDPMLAMPGLRAALAASTAPVLAVSPLIAGAAVKGPTAKLMRELGLEPGALAVAAHYHGLIDGFVLDVADAALAAQLSVPSIAVPTLMREIEDRERLARAVLDFADRLRDAPRLRRAS